MREIVLHIGAHRTGTTALQKLLSRNREVLSASGYAYPGDQANHQRLVWDIHSGRVNARSAVRAIVEASDTPRIVLSGEDFCIHRNLDWVKDLAQDHSVRVFLYVRRQDDWIMSWYNQHVKWPFSRLLCCLSADEFLGRIDDFYWIDYFRTASLWSDAVGKGNVTVRVVQKGEVENVAADFLYLATTDLVPSLMSEANAIPRENDSLPVTALETARHLGLVDLNTVGRMKVLGALRKVFDGTEGPYRTLYSSKQRQQILARFADSNRKLAEQFLCRSYAFDTSSIDDSGYLDISKHPEFHVDVTISSVIARLVGN